MFPYTFYEHYLIMCTNVQLLAVLKVMEDSMWKTYQFIRSRNKNCKIQNILYNIYNLYII